MKGIWGFLLMKAFFGLNNEYAEAVYEEIFYLKYYGGWSIFETYNLPTTIRRWFLQRMQKQMEKEAEEIKKQSKK